MIVICLSSYKQILGIWIRQGPSLPTTLSGLALLRVSPLHPKLWNWSNLERCIYSDVINSIETLYVWTYPRLSPLHRVILPLWALKLCKQVSFSCGATWSSVCSYQVTVIIGTRSQIWGKPACWRYPALKYLPSPKLLKLIWCTYWIGASIWTHLGLKECSTKRLDPFWTPKRKWK